MALFTKHNSLQRRIFSYFLLFTLSFTLLGFFIVSQIFFRNYISSEKEHAISSSNKAKQSIEYMLNMTNNTASLLSTSGTLLNALSQSETIDDEVYSMQKNEVDIMLKSIISVHEYIDNIYVIGSDGEFFTSYWNTDQKEVEARFSDFLKKQKTRSEYLNGEPIISYLPFFDLNVISYTRPIFKYPEDEGMGSLIIDLNYTYLREMFMFSSLQQDDEKLLVINKSGEVLFNFPFNISLSHIIDEYPDLLKENREVQGKVFGKESFIISSSIAFSDWSIIRIISREKIYKTINYLIEIGLIIWIILLIISFFVSLVISVSITRPVIELNNTICNIEQGNLGLRASGEGPDEIGQLATSFNHMVDRISDLMKKTLEEQKQKSDLEFQILQSQINPHFLYNTLDSIKWLAVFQNVENISDMVTSLINLLKYNISKKSKLVTLSEEIDCIRDYVEIQRFRFGDAFDIIYDIDEESEHVYILKFILQPLVENALFHGFENIEYQGVVTIRGRVVHNKLELAVIDNGKGLVDVAVSGDTESSLKRKKMHSSIGLSNVADRLRLHFGGDVSFSLNNNPDRGVGVYISLPLLDDVIKLPEQPDDILGIGDRSKE